MIFLVSFFFDGCDAAIIVTTVQMYRYPPENIT